ncbi:MAG: MATE family efflux transporter [Lachnospiraceae bacterium]|nr:MATE family efflux transporter [Lachnospiraceae bacterium]
MNENKKLQKPWIVQKFIGDKKFYQRVLFLAVPIMIQNGITNFVSLLDNIMIGQIGTVQMSGASIVNQLIFVYFLCIFGAVSGAGIFTAQYYGKQDMEGIQYTFRFKLLISTLLTVLAIVLFCSAGDHLITLYLSGEGKASDAAAILRYGGEYLSIILFGLPAFMLGQAYASTLRECGETMLPMKAGLAAVFVNLTFNYLLIFGKFGFPQLGVEGAAIATVLSRYVEAAIIVVWTHLHKKENPYIVGLYRSFYIPAGVMKNIIIKGTPLLFNEGLWASGVAMLTQCYSVRGLSVVASLNIANTINNVFNVVFIALGDSVAIIVGQLLGAGEMEEARDTDTKMIAFSVCSCVLIGGLMLLFAPLFPMLYNTSNEVRQLATEIIMVSALFMPQSAFLHAAYFTLRSGGKTFITFLFDSASIWCVSVPVVYVLSRFTGLSMIMIYVAYYLTETFKAILGFVLVKKGIWLQNIVKE